MAVVISAQTAEFSRAMAVSNAQLKSFQGTVRALGASLGITFGGYTIYRGLSYGIGVLADFEKEMSAVRSVTNASDAEFNTLSRSALDLGRSTLYGAQAVASLQLAYSRLGFTTREIIDASSATIDLATATGEDLAKSADIAGVTIRAFGLQANETRRVADILAVGFNKTALGLDNFGEAIKYVAPIAAAQNITLEETVAVLGTLADAGIRGSLAGTATRKIFSLLGGTTGTINERFKQLAASGFTNADAFDEVGRTAQSALLTLVKYNDKTDELTKATKSANGEIANMAAVMAENLSGDFTRLRNAVDGLILSFEHSDKIREFTRNITALINVIGQNKGGQLSDGLDELAKSIAGENGLIGGEKYINSLIENLKILRIEAGKPIDEGAIEGLKLRYKLTKEEAEKLVNAINEINKAQSFDEAELGKFKAFNERLKNETQDYKGLINAANQYKRTVHDEIEALRARGKALIDSRLPVAAGEDSNDKEIKFINEQIRSLRHVNDLINQYAEANKEVAKAVPVPEQKEQLGLIQQLEKKIKDFGDAIKTSMNPKDILSYTQSIKLLSEEIDKLTGKKPSVELPIQNVFNQAPDGDVLSIESITAKFKKIKEDLGYTVKEIERGFINLNEMAADFAITFAQVLGEGLGSGFQDFGKTLLLGIAKFMRQFGVQLIALGIGAQSLKKLFAQPAVAIAAGIALVAAAGAVASHAQGGLNAAAGGGGGGVASARYADRSDAALEITGEVVVVQKGSDLVGAITAQNFKANRTGGKRLG